MKRTIPEDIKEALSIQDGEKIYFIKITDDREMPHYIITRQDIENQNITGIGKTKQVQSSMEKKWKKNGTIKKANYFYNYLYIRPPPTVQLNKSMFILNYCSDPTKPLCIEYGEN